MEIMNYIPAIKIIVHKAKANQEQIETIIKFFFVFLRNPECCGPFEEFLDLIYKEVAKTLNACLEAEPRKRLIDAIMWCFKLIQKPMFNSLPIKKELKALETMMSMIIKDSCRQV
jgi:hypothetical protein